MKYQLNYVTRNKKKNMTIKTKHKSEFNYYRTDYISFYVAWDIMWSVSYRIIVYYITMPYQSMRMYMGKFRKHLGYICRRRRDT